MPESSIDQINTISRAAEHRENMPAPPHQLHLRTARPFADLAESISHLLWAGIAQHETHIVLDSHRFPSLTRIITDVLVRHLQSYRSIDQAHWGFWAQTRGGAPTRHPQSPLCEEHTQRILNEAGAQVEHVLVDLEKAVLEFFPPQAIEAIQQTIRESVKPNLIWNVASSACDNCQK